jgi:hypothetical protein
MEGGDNPVAQANEIQELARVRVFSGNGYLILTCLRAWNFAVYWV